MSEGRRRRAERPEQLDLHGGVRDVVLAADHVGDVESDIIDHGRQGV